MISNTLILNKKVCPTIRLNYYALVRFGHINIFWEILDYITVFNCYNYQNYLYYQALKISK